MSKLIMTGATLLLTFVLSLYAAEEKINQEFMSGNQKFAADIYVKAAEEEERANENFLICPISLETAMAVVYAGARGATAEQIANGLHLPNDQEQVASIFRDFLPTLRGSQLYNLSVANRLFISEGYRILDSFKNNTVEIFGAGIESVDFAKSKQAVATINHWVEQETNNKIHDLIQESDVDEDTRLIIVNAVYFNATWAKQFKTGDTFKAPFYKHGKSAVAVDTMHITEGFKYYECSKLNAKFLEMPYEGHELSMVFVLPNERDGLSAIEARISEVFEPKNFTNELVEVSLPRFTIESTIHFIPILEKLGVEGPFKSSADLTGISGEPLQITKIIQKTFMNVTEEGTEAAAATAGRIVPLSAPHMPFVRKHFVADHPFIFYIKASGVPLFSGRFVEK